MKLEDFVGNFNKKEELVNWLNEFFHDKVESTKRYAIIFGISGNGKTLLPRLLADAFETELFVINPLDIKNNNDIYNVIKSLNLQSFTHLKKIILIDDINEFADMYRKKLLGITSVYPIIYTCDTIAFLDPDFKNAGLRIKLKKPITSKLVEHLKKKANSMDIKISDEKVEMIARQSTSVRSAENSLYTALVSGLSKPYKTHEDILKTISKRCFNRHLTRDNIHWIFNSIRGYDEKTLSVMKRFAEFDYRIKVQFEQVDPYFINNMVEPIEDIVFEKRYLSNQEPKVNKKPEPKKEKVEIKKEPNLAKYGL